MYNEENPLITPKRPISTDEYDDGNIPDIDLPKHSDVGGFSIINSSDHSSNNSAKNRSCNYNHADNSAEPSAEPLPESTRPRKDGPGGE